MAETLRKMQIFFFPAGSESDEIKDLEKRLKTKLPTLERVAKLEDVRKLTADTASEAEPVFVILPVPASGTPLDRLIAITEQERSPFFFIFVSNDISASDYKRLVRSGGADWVSLRDAPREIEEIIGRANRAEPAAPNRPDHKPKIVVLQPSAGGVGNTTLAVEAAVQLKADKKNRSLRVLLIDLDFQTSHVCDYLDIEPRLQMREIIDQPERLDAQLLNLFISSHSSGVDVLASPRSREEMVADVGAMDALFGLIAPRYDVVIVDLPPQWSRWTSQLLSIADLVVVSGVNTVPGLRQVADTLRVVKELEPPPVNIVVALNRCEPKFPSGIARAQHIKKILPDATVITVRSDSGAAIHAVNTGVPISVENPSGKIAKDIRALTTLIAAPKATQP